MDKKIFLSLFLCFSVAVLMAQSAADSLSIVSADWEIKTLDKGIDCRKASFTSLYGVPQQISILEISPRHHHFEVLIHNLKEETSVAARRSGALAAINGSYFDMKNGNSVCYLRKDGLVVDTTAAGLLSTVCNGAVYIKKGKLKLMPWNKYVEKKYSRRKGTILSSGPFLLEEGQTCDFSECNQNFVNARHPRSAIALAQNGKILFIVVDGRRKGKAEGVSIIELTHLIRVLGGLDALNLDGGGSSTLWSRALPGDGIVNTPSGSAERKVANSVCVYK